MSLERARPAGVPQRILDLESLVCALRFSESPEVQSVLSHALVQPVPRGAGGLVCALTCFSSGGTTDSGLGGGA